MTHTFVSLTNRKWQEKKIVEGHSTMPVHQERTTYPPGGLGDIGAYEIKLCGADAA